MSPRTSGMFAGLPPGIHPLPSPPSDSSTSLRDEATECGLFFAEIDLTDCEDKACLLQRFAGALSFPDWFGHNWDAFADCLADLDWLAAPGHVLVIEGSVGITRHSPDAVVTCREILAETVARRSEHGLPMWVFWRNCGLA